MDHLQPFTFGSTHSEPKAKPAPLDRPSFTFIDHDDDLTSKRIKDVNARKAIRSHVMRDVRRRERLAGLKRTSRQNRGQSGSSKPTVDESDEQRLVLRASSQSSASSSILDTDSGDRFTSIYRGRPVRWCAGYPLPLHSNPNPPTSWFLDPFFTLPGTNELPSMVAHLVYYWKTIFVPMTFPNTSKDSNQEMELMVRSSFSDPGSFFGLMSMCAAHRAVLASQRSGNWDSVLTDDPDYCMMRAKSIQEMSAKVRDPSRRLSNEAFDTIINLLTGSLIIGEFSEVHTHLTGLKSMVDLRGGITDESIRSSSMLSAIITTDIKAASGLMTKPVFPLTWDAQPIPSEIQQRIRPLASSPLNRLGTGFFANTFLSPPLLRIISVLRDMVFFSVTYQTNPNVIKPGDQDFFRILNCEAEHQLLSYIYAEGSPNPEPNLHPIEAVTRVASICYLNHFLIVSPSSSGLGRALTKHLKTALDSCKLSLLVGLPNQTFGLYVWALFVGAQGALGQPERQWFVERLARVAMICGWQSWEQISKLMAEFFFVAALDSLNWRSVWDEAMTGFVISESEELEFSSLLGTGTLSLA
ncbi:hypothetical protein N7447_006720 [Penicillium robsamsonii]|uniref:uncharacterized protein n=1 Tax=Penicillium robsamsonii TaxID=1792511 RepID=UPI00254696E9|nr:uncharacterized protein N7447_006720 [Penicillium robsamsonii]KAJ5824380.1 hypothetical protein N7447_006720 [Penicillium robsamsonii]